MESKRRKVNSSNENNPATIFGHGCKGVFVTCDRNREGNAATEVYRLLEDYLESIKETEESPNNDLDKELEELSKKKHPSQFSRIDLGMKGITFIRILDETISPVAAVKYIFKKIKSTGVSSARYAARIIPIEYSCYAHMEDAVATVKKAIQEVFTDDKKGQTWFCDIKRRNNNTFDRDAFIKAIIPFIDSSKNPVCLRNGDICIHVDIDKGVCGISIITEWKELNDLSLRTILDEKKPKLQKEETKDQVVNALDKDWKCGSV
ncbi:hypothetical protein WA171_002649 [Blastocystis sp. BT1]